MSTPTHAPVEAHTPTPAATPPAQAPAPTTPDAPKGEFKPWHAIVMFGAAAAMIIGAIVIVAPSAVQKDWKDITAVVTHVDEREVRRSRRSFSTSRMRTIYTPTFEYTVNSIPYTTKNPLSVRERLFVGKHIVVRYNPEQPKQAEYGGTQRWAGLILIAPALAFIIGGWVLLVKHRKKTAALQQLP